MRWTTLTQRMSPNRQLAQFFLLAFTGVAILMLALHYAGSALSGSNGDVSAVDEDANSISIIIREEPPQLNSSRATDAISRDRVGGSTAVQLGRFLTNDDGNAVSVFVHRRDIAVTAAESAARVVQCQH